MDIVAVHAGAKPDAPALVTTDRVVTWAEYAADKNRLANALVALGVQAGERLVAYHYNSPEGFVIGAAADTLGLTAVPLNHRLTAPEAAYIIDDSDAGVVVYGEEFADIVADVAPNTPNVRQWICMGTPRLEGAHAWADLLAEQPDTAPGELGEGGGTMIYTSGTTGNPKGAFRAPGQAGAMIQLLQNCMSEFDMRPDDAHLAAGPLYHSAPRAFAQMAQIIGKTIVIQRRFDPAEALRLIGEWNVGDTFMAPLLVKRLVEVPAGVWDEVDTTPLHSIVVAGAPCPEAVKRAAAERLGPVLYEFYGSTELGINTVLKPDDMLRKPGSCGRAFPDVDIRIIGDDETEVAQGEAGEIFVSRTPLTISEYHKRPDALADATLDDYVTVGDVGYLDDEGYLFISDRKKDMIISGGVNIYPAEIENVLHDNAAIADAAVFGIPDEDWGESVHAVIELKDGASLTVEELLAWSSDKLAGYKRPRSIEFVEQLPRDTAGKLIKRKLRDPYWEGHETRVL